MPPHLTRLSALSLGLVLACHGAKVTPPAAAPVPTPEQVLASNPSAGAAIHVQGTVFAVTFDNIHDPSQDPNGGYTPMGDRYVLIRTTVPDGVQSGPDLQMDDDALRRGWGLALKFDDAKLRSGALVLPRLGAEVDAQGTFQPITWDHQQRPALVNLQSFVVAHGQLDLLALGAACATDTDCRDELICVRRTKTCGPPPADAMNWGDAWHDVNGACDTDDDCPLQQVCDASFAMSPSDAFPTHYVTPGDFGRHLCVPDQTLTQAQLCPRPVISEDLAGGRFILGKEVCIVGEIMITTHPPDGDTHVEMQADDPLVFPVGTVPVYLFGAVTENAPPYKNSGRLGGAIADPALKQKVVALGTYRYDPGHGWFELHPIKKWWPAAQ
jgi:hypothetical protein